MKNIKKFAAEQNMGYEETTKGVKVTYKDNVYEIRKTGSTRYMKVRGGYGGNIAGYQFYINNSGRAVDTYKTQKEATEAILNHIRINNL